MLRIKEAIQKHNSRRNMRLTQNELARLLWPYSKPGTQKVNMSNLVTGRVSTIKLEMIPIICDTCGVDANFLFNIKQ